MWQLCVQQGAAWCGLWHNLGQHNLGAAPQTLVSHAHPLLCCCACSPDKTRDLYIQQVLLITVLLTHTHIRAVMPVFHPPPYTAAVTADLSPAHTLCCAVRICAFLCLYVVRCHLLGCGSCASSRVLHGTAARHVVCVQSWNTMNTWWLHTRHGDGYVPQVPLLHFLRTRLYCRWNCL